MFAYVGDALRVPIFSFRREGGAARPHHVAGGRSVALRHEDLGDDVGWNFNRHRNRAAVSPPRAPNFASNRVELCIRPAKLRVENRRDSNPTEARLERRDSADRLEHPARNRTVGIVRKRVHARVLVPLLGRPAVPPLPDRGRPVDDREAPRREGRVVQQSERHVISPDL